MFAELYDHDVTSFLLISLFLKNNSPIIVGSSELQSRVQNYLQTLDPYSDTNRLHSASILQ